MSKFIPLIATLERIAVALWWGGFTFYAAVVVPLGAQVTDETTQGFVTQKVTHGFNILALIILALSFPTCWLTGKLNADATMLQKRGRLARRVAWVVMLATLAGLVIVHSLLDSRLDPKTLSIQGSSDFYKIHQAYLWLAIFQWHAGWVFLLLPPDSAHFTPKETPSESPLGQGN